MYILQRRLNIAEGHATLDDRRAADQGSDGVADEVYNLRERHNRAGIRFRPAGRFSQPPVDIVKADDGLLLPVKRGNDVLSVKDFFHITVHFSQKLLLTGIAFRRHTHNTAGGQKSYGNHDDGNKREPGRKPEEHGDNSRRVERLRDYLIDILAQERVDGFNIVGYDGKHFTAHMCVVVVQLQAVHFCVDRVSQFPYYLRGDPG